MEKRLERKKFWSSLIFSLIKDFIFYSITLLAANFFANSVIGLITNVFILTIMLFFSIIWNFISVKKEVNRDLKWEEQNKEDNKELRISNAELRIKLLEKKSGS